MDTSAWKTEAICENSRIGGETQPWRVKSPQADLNEVPFLCPLSPTEPSPRSQQDVCTSGILYHCSSPSGISAAQPTPPYLPKSFIPSAGCSAIPIPALRVHIPAALQGLAMAGCCFCPPTAVGQCQKSSSGAEAEISPGIPAPRGDKLQGRSKLQVLPFRALLEREVLRFFLGTESLWGQFQAFEDKEESLVQPAGN